MAQTTYFRWVAHEHATTPDWDRALGHIEQLPTSALRDEHGRMLEWTDVDEVLALPEEAPDDPAAEMLAVRRRLMIDLEALQRTWSGGRNDATRIERDTERIILSGGWPGGDYEYPTEMCGALARLIGSGAAQAAGFEVDAR